MKNSLDLLPEICEETHASPQQESSTADPLREFLDYFYEFIRDNHPDIIPILDKALKNRYVYNNNSNNPKP